MVIPYRTTKFKSTNIHAIVILGSTAKFNCRQYFQLYSTTLFWMTHKWHISVKKFLESSVPGPTSYPSLDEVHTHIRGITQCIQELLQAAQSQKQDSFAPCSAKIMNAVDTMIRSFPAVSCGQNLNNLGLRLYLRVQILADFGNSVFSGYSF